MDRPPAFQFYPKDWLDFRVQRMSLAAQGAYVKLLCFMWKDSQDQCSIIDNDRAIATAIGVPCEIWKDLREEIQFPGDPILKEDGQFLRSERLQREAEKQQNYARQQAEKGKRGAQKRWAKEDSHGHSNGHAPAIAQGMTENSSSSSSSLIDIQRDEPLSHLPTDRRSSSKPSGKRKSMLTPMPDGFAISDDLRDWTVKKGYPREVVEREFDTFCNDRLSKGVQYADWDRAFMTWLSRHDEFGKPQRNGHATASTQRRKERLPL